MAYDSSRFFTVLFGGIDNNLNFLGDTWEFDGINWFNRSSTTQPSVRAGHAMAFDSVQQKTVLFGGVVTNAGCPSGCYQGDTWVWNGTWGQLATSSAPSARAYHAMAYDSVRRKIVLFGGRDQALKGDTWELDVASGTWTNVTPPSGPNPSPRFHHAMAYDIENRVTVLFGGDTAMGASQSGETWIWDGSAWTQQFPAVGPTARYGHKMAFDTAFHRIVLFGGAEVPSGSLKNDTWSWNGTTWIEDVHTPIPSARLNHAMAYDSDRDQVVLFGGVANGQPVVDGVSTWQWHSLGDDDAAQLDFQGNVVFPADLDPSEPIVEEEIDMDTGYVADLYPGLNTSLDTWYPEFPCEPDIGGTVPLEASNPDLDAELAAEGITGATPQEIADALSTWEDAIDQVARLEVDNLPTSPPVTASYTPPSPPHCVDPGCGYVFGGRDIVFVHGLDTQHLLDKINGLPAANTAWHPVTSFPGSIQNPEFYGTGYYKLKANAYWHQHIKRFLKDRGIQNRYLIVAFSSNDRLELGVQAILTQIGDAMGPQGIGVVDPSNRNDTTKFGTPSFVIISHSTGGLVSDVAMAAAAAHPNLNAQFIPPLCKAHIAAAGAFSGSRLATAAVALSGFAATVTPDWVCELARKSLFSTAGPACPIVFNTVKDSVLVDLVPLVTQSKWGGYISAMPVPTLTVIGGHPSLYGPLKFLLQPGFDDGVLTINSQVANPNSTLLWPSGFAPKPFFALNKLFDMGVAFAGNQPEVGLRSPTRAILYYRDQVLDRFLNPLSFFALPGPLVAAGATPYVSPTGMLQPVGHEYAMANGFNPMRRYPRHYSFLQSAADHFQGTTDITGQDIYYGDTYPFLFHEHNFEETRVITDPQVYANVPMPIYGDNQPLLSNATVPKVKETLRGKKVSFKRKIFQRLFPKGLWIWKRRYHLLEGWRDKVQFDYVYDSVLKHAPSYTCGVNPADDCNGNGIPDTCDIANGTSTDCNHNGIPDSCDIANGTSRDDNHDGVPDESRAKMLNLSTRLRVQTGNNVMIGGFIITGNALKDVALRGIGPSLSQFGIPGVLADPTLKLNAANLIENDNWQDYPQGGPLSGLNLGLQDPKEAGIVATLQPASYTAILAGNNGTAGTGLLELYDTNSAADSELANISTRGFVETGSTVMIGGFILGGGCNQGTGIVIRGIGPSLASFGLSPLLVDPTLELRDSNGVLLISNDDWQDDPVQAATLAAKGLALSNAKEAGIYAFLPSGAFTAILAGKDGGTGIGLLEIYNVH